ncbi:MAG TPA: methyltransferase domain-containing protein [bacterium]|nr:methyltransferase domain-containing protein [bacterium]HPO10593.1 methyltransferase domain-containing protein [bacterium]HQO35636.1 methyltransferase domain-containing protein [bacterium]
MSIHERLLFLSSFRKRFHDTGAVTPSSRALACAMTEGLESTDTPRVLLEVGPGTGAFTRQILSKLGPEDELHLCEINGELLDYLRKEIESDRTLPNCKDRIVYHNCPVQELDGDLRVHHIVSGLPFNNFPPSLVKEILETYQERLLPGGTLRFFEYLAIRDIKIHFVNREERTRLLDIERVLCGFCGRHDATKKVVWLNLPPAIAWRLRMKSRDE